MLHIKLLIILIDWIYWYFVNLTGVLIMRVSCIHVYRFPQLLCGFWVNDLLSHTLHTPFHVNMYTVQYPFNHNIGIIENYHYIQYIYQFIHKWLGYWNSIWTSTIVIWLLSQWSVIIHISHSIPCQYIHVNKTM